jgi:predicted amidohydrolase YtcJ
MLDVRLVNANVVTMDRDRPAAREIGLWRGRVVGVDDAVASLRARHEVDLDGATVLPGFVDAHTHLAWTGLAATAPSLAPCRDLDAMLATVRRAAAAKPVGEWVDIVGYDQRPRRRHLTAAELDAVSAGRKVFVIHDSGHACVVNSAVLALLPDGVEHRDGFLAEQGMAAVRRMRQPYPVDELVDAIETAAQACLAEGVVAAAEAGIGGGLVSHSPIEAAAYVAALEQGRLPIRVQLMVAAAALRPVDAHATDATPRAIDLGLRTGFGGDRLSIGALKVFTDGGMMARTAALTSPYEGIEGSGQLYDDAEVIAAQIVDGHRAGWQLAVHAIGDRAVDVALDALDRAQAAHPRPDARHRIEHAGVVRPDQLDRFARLGVTAVVQPNFLRYFGDDYAAIMGAERLGWLYRGRGFLDHGVRLAGSSDRPVTVGAPLPAMQFMVERASESGVPIGPGEAITVEEALRAYTADAAWACHWEDSLGTIAPGHHADFVVLADDPRRLETSRIGGIEVVATVVGGVVEHGAELLREETS